MTAPMATRCVACGASFTPDEIGACSACETLAPVEPMPVVTDEALGRLLYATANARALALDPEVVIEPWEQVETDVRDVMITMAVALRERMLADVTPVLNAAARVADLNHAIEHEEHYEDREASRMEMDPAKDALTAAVCAARAAGRMPK